MIWMSAAGLIAILRQRRPTMAIVDERGRLFGRFNLIDASLVAVLVLLLPIAYAATRCSGRRPCGSRR